MRSLVMLDEQGGKTTTPLIYVIYSLIFVYVTPDPQLLVLIYLFSNQLDALDNCFAHSDRDQSNN